MPKSEYVLSFPKGQPCQDELGPVSLFLLQVMRSPSTSTRPDQVVYQAQIRARTRSKWGF